MERNGIFHDIILRNGTEQIHVTLSASTSILFGGHGRPRTAKSIHYIQLYSYHVCKAIVAIMSDLLATNKLKIQCLSTWTSP